MTDYTLESIRPLVCLDCIAGSKAYGLDVPTSDDDYKGVYLAPLRDVLTGKAPKVVMDEGHDIQYTELGDFCAQLLANTPAALELLHCIGQEQMLSCAPWLRGLLAGRRFLSRKCLYTYGQYATRQINKTLSTHNKAANPMPVERKTLADFSFVIEGGRTLPLAKWLEGAGLSLRDVAAARIDHAEELYALYRHPSPKGLFGSEGTGVALANIPKGTPQLGYLAAHIKQFSAHCKEYAQYWEWHAKRNPARFEPSARHPHQAGEYDVKHMMHAFRLLHTAAEIAKEGTIHVRRTHDNEFLRSIRAGIHPLADLVQRANDFMTTLPALYADSDLPEEPEAGQLWEDIADLRIRLNSNDSRQ